VKDDHKAELDRHFAWFEAKLPPRPARFVGWLRKPSSKLVRIPLAVLLVGGGIFSFLPVLGLWMLPLGLVLIAQDVPALEKPTAKTLGWIERKWAERQRAKGVELGPLPGIPGPADAAGTADNPAVTPRAKAGTSG
jgi:hypothetical protein